MCKYKISDLQILLNIPDHNSRTLKLLCEQAAALELQDVVILEATELHIKLGEVFCDAEILVEELEDVVPVLNDALLTDLLE